MSAKRTQAELEQRVAALEAQLGVAEPSSTPPAGQVIELTQDDLYEYEDEPALQLATWLGVANANVLLIAAGQLREGATVQHEINRLVRQGFKLADAELVVGEVKALVSGRIPPGRMNGSDELAALRRAVASNLRSGQSVGLAIAAVTKQLRNRAFAEWVVRGVATELTHTPAQSAPHIAEPGWSSSRPEPEPEPAWSSRGQPIPLGQRVFPDPVDEASGPLPEDPIFARNFA